MVDFFKSWCEGIIVAVIISIIIETILPEGNNKKYVKVVVGIYIIFTILNPFLGKLNADIDFTNGFELNTIEVTSENTDNIKEMYATGIKETLKNNIEEELGYTVSSIEIIYDENYENIESIALKIKENGIQEIEAVQIGNQVQEKQSTKEYPEIKKYISENYELDQSKIIINE